MIALAMGMACAVPGYAADNATLAPPPAGPTNITEKVNPKDGAAMVLVPAGEFLMGSKEGQGKDGERPQRQVTLDSYYIYKYEVTVAEYRKFCEKTHRAMPPEPSWKWQDTHPIVNVTWYDARAYAAWAGAALPTEAQFEKAARGTDGRTFVWGNSFTKSTCHTSDGKTAPVGSYPTGVSPYGALDMAGNVWEWCDDWYDPDYYAIAPTDNPLGPATGTTRVLRGGSWGFNVAEFFQVTYRNRCLPGCRYGDYGFRCVLLVANGETVINDRVPALPAAPQAAVSPARSAEPMPLPLTNRSASDWPQLGGPAANGISPETGINTDWTAHVPPVLWFFQMHDAGGYAHNTIVNGTVYIVDHAGNSDILRALDLTIGTQRWESGYEDAKSPDNGFMRGCPVFDNGKLYTFSRTGNANCFDADTGRILWSRNLQKEYNGRKADWGYTASPFVDGNQVIYVPGGQGASVVALDKNTGVTHWKSGSDAAGHATPVVATIRNVRQYVLFNAFGAVGVKADDGTQLWRHQWTTQHSCNAQSPIVMGNKVFITSGYGVGCAMLEIAKDWKVTEIWKDKELIGRTARPILYRGYIYCTDETTRLICLNPETGMNVWTKEGFGGRLNYAWKDGFSCGSGGLILVDGALLVVSETTKSIVAVKATPKGYQELGRLRILVSGSELFTSPSFSNGKLVVRDKKNLYCVDLSLSAAATTPNASAPPGVSDGIETLPGQTTLLTNGAAIAVAQPNEPALSPTKAVSDASWQGQFQNNWPRFRGLDGSGFAPKATAPVAWDEQAKSGVLWKASIAQPGFNSPIVWGNRVFISGGSAEKREVYCHDATDGKLVWTRAVENLPGSPAKIPDISESAGYAAPTMATDGRLVFAMFANGDLAAVNFNGSIAWARNLGVPQNPYGHAASLAVWRDKLIVQLDQGDNKPAISRLTLFEAATGKLVWEQPRQVSSSWASPIVVEAAGKTQIITAGLPWLAAYSFADGAELWKAEVLEGEVTPSPILAGGLVFIANPNSTLIALRPDGAGDVTKTHVAWACEENVPDSSSPTSNGEVVFYASSVGMGTCLDAKTGRKLWEHDFGTGIHASPGIAGSRVYVVSTDGHGWVLQAGREYKELGRGALNDKFYASPAFAGGRIYLRGHASLYCIGEK